MYIRGAKRIFITSIFTLALSGSILAASDFQPVKPASLSDYRLSYEEMHSIANSHVLPHRIFYYPSVGPHTKWFDAIKKGNLAQVKEMVESGQPLEAKDNLSGRGQTALGWAAFIGYEDIVNYLIDKGADLYATDDADVKNALKSAALGKNADVAKAIYSKLKGKIDINDQSADKEAESLLMIAASNNRIEMVNYLLSIGAKVDLVSEPLQQNALTYACSRGHQDIVDILIKHGAVNFKTGKKAC
ncbi:ankyrin repeat domain-containing protein [Aeromonas sp. 11P]|uniref:ankyrin repeat domain-containing protein n=1 Tax=Aeromonas sp. 11P TaxID=3452713 RepID=UPI003F795120